MKDNIFDVSCFIITKFGEVVDLYEFDKTDNSGRFIMFTNDNLNYEYSDDNSICIYKSFFNYLKEIKNWMIKDKYIDGIATIALQIDHSDAQTEQRNMDFINNKEFLCGFCQTHAIMQNITKIEEFRGLSKEKSIPAIAHAYNKMTEFNGKHIHGYLPAIGQLVYLLKNMKKFKYAYELLNNNNEWIRLPLSKLWSSTQYSRFSVWVMDLYEQETTCYDKVPTLKYVNLHYPYVLPFYKLDL